MKCKNYVSNYPKAYPRCKTTKQICLWNENTKCYCAIWRENRIKLLTEKQEDYCCFNQEGGKLSEKGEQKFSEVSQELGYLMGIDAKINPYKYPGFVEAKQIKGAE